MTDQQKTIDTLNAENAGLKRQVQQTSDAVHGLLAQIDAHKQELNNAIQNSIMLRTNTIILQKSNKELVDKINALNAMIADLNKKLEIIPPKKDTANSKAA